MRCKQFLIALALLTPAVTHAEEVVRIATYNIFFLADDVSDTRANRIKTVIDKLGADVIGLQEIKDRPALERVFDSSEWQLVIDDDSGDTQDVALAVRRPFSVIDLNNDPNDLDADDDDFLCSDEDDSAFPRRRDVLSVHVKVPNNSGDFWVLVVHPKARRDGRTVTDPRRKSAARILLNKLEHGFDGRRYFVIGDWNDNPDDRSLNILENGDPDAPAGPEEIRGPFLLNLAEELIVDNHVSWGLKASDATGDIVDTIKPGSRDKNNDQRGGTGSAHPILFDQILIPMSMEANYVAGSMAVFNDSVVKGGHPKQGGPSDHVPVSADFVFDGTTDTPTPPATRPPGAIAVKIISAIPNPNGTDSGNETVTLKNGGNEAVDLDGWMLRDRAAHTFVLSGEIGAGQERVIKLPAGSVPLNNDGDSVELLKKDGTNAHRAEYDRTVGSGEVVTFTE